MLHCRTKGKPDTNKRPVNWYVVKLTTYTNSSASFNLVSITVTTHTHMSKGCFQFPLFILPCTLCTLWKCNRKLVSSARRILFQKQKKQTEQANQTETSLPRNVPEGAMAKIYVITYGESEDCILSIISFPYRRGDDHGRRDGDKIAIFFLASKIDAPNVDASPKTRWRW